MNLISSLETGKINLIRLKSATEEVIVRRNVGSIDYIKGEIKLNPVNIISTSISRDFPLIEISAVPYSNDIIGLQDLYIQLDTNNITINSINDRILLVMIYQDLIILFLQVLQMEV